MTKKEYCTSNPAIAYYSGFNGLEIHGFEYGVDDFMYCVSGAWGGGKAYHRLKIYYPADGNKSAYVRLHGYRVPLDECIRMGV